jgi:hypothetical protein
MLHVLSHYTTVVHKPDEHTAQHKLKTSWRIQIAEGALKSNCTKIMNHDTSIHVFLSLKKTKEAWQKGSTQNLNLFN